MSNSIVIKWVHGREILDSRGNPTVEVDVHLSNGILGRSAVPSGASIGKHEAVELRDKDPSRFDGAGALQAISNVEKFLGPAVLGMSPFDQKSVDLNLTAVDGTPDKSRLGGNSVLGVSMAVAHAAANSTGTPLYRYLAGSNPVLLPIPLLNILNGGKHAENSVDFQEFMVVPAGIPDFSRALQAGTEVYQALKRLLKSQGHSTNVGDEGGFAPSLTTTRSALESLNQAIGEAGYESGKEIFLALDVAATELYQNGRYLLTKERMSLTSADLVSFYQELVEEFPIVSIEDGMAEDDWDGWCELMRSVGGKVQLVGDDLFTTNTERIQKGIDLDAANAVLIKPNQIGTLTETFAAIELSKHAKWGVVMSHRSGETEDTTIADLAVATGSGQIKCGAPARSERVAKYNRLLRISEELGSDRRFPDPREYYWGANR